MPGKLKAHFDLYLVNNFILIYNFICFWYEKMCLILSYLIFHKYDVIQCAADARTFSIS